MLCVNIDVSIRICYCEKFKYCLLPKSRPIGGRLPVFWCGLEKFCCHHTMGPTLFWIEFLTKITRDKIATIQCSQRGPVLSMHIVNFLSRHAPILCKHTCIVSMFHIHSTVSPTRMFVQRWVGSFEYYHIFSFALLCTVDSLPVFWGDTSPPTRVPNTRQP